jgi:ACS family hexuronate transporter-like MFS transporter
MFARMRWLIAFLLFLGGVINYIDRSALSVAAPLVAKDLGLKPGALGVVFSSFFFGYAIFSFVGGYAADRFGPRRVLTVSMTAWSIFCGLTAAAFNVTTLLIFRALFGAAEGPFPSNVNKTVGRWFPQRERASALGVGNSGTPLGGALAGPIVGYIAVAFGWRISFVVVMLLGLFWVVAWVVFSTDSPEQNRRVSKEELREILSQREAGAAPGTKRSLWQYLRNPAVLATTCGFFAYTYLLYFFLSWFPSYLTMVQHLSIQRMGIVSAIPWLLGFLGFLAGGFICDWIFQKIGNVVLARKIVLVTGLSVAGACAAMAGMVTGVVAAVTLMAVSIFFMYGAAHTYWALILELVEPDKVGTVGGFAHFMANCSGVIAPIITGFLVQWTHAFTSAFILAGVISAMGALSVSVFVRSKTPSKGASVPVLTH